MRLVHAQERGTRGLEDLAHIGGLQRFRSGEHDELTALLETGERGGAGALSEGAVEAHHRNTAGEQSPLLVLHQRDEREQGDHRALREHRQHLVDE